MRWGLALLMVVATGEGAARADHTKEDAQATTRRLEAILHPPKKAKAKAKVETAKVEPATVQVKAIDPFYAIVLAVFGR
ncbi:MAG TPA: hypothetical protein VN947_00730 [Polyangia bacterium]|nr:hypothetical protein [Polyangia bacterium]